MPAQKGLSDLAERKRLLILEADLHRALLRAEAVRARARLGWLNPGGGGLRLSPWLLVGGALAGLVAARHASTVLKWLPTALDLWRRFRHRAPD